MFNLNAEEATPEAARQRKILIAGLAGVALLVVLGAVFVLPGLFGGSSDASAAVAIPHHSAKPNAIATSGPTPTPTPSATSEPVAAATGRDPFAPLPQEVAATAAAATTSGSTSTGSTANAGSTTDAGTASTAPSGSPTATPAPSTTAATSTAGTASSGTTTSSLVAGKPVQYMSFVGAGTAKIEIDTTDYTVKAGQTVAGYSIVSVSSGSVQVAHGNKTTTLALGELQTF